MLATFFSSLSSSGAVQGITGIITLLASAAFYKYIIDFIEPWEEAIRTRNNKPDMRHLPMTTMRKLSFRGVLVSIVLLIGYGLFAEDMGGWVFLVALIILVSAFTTILTTWPRGDEYVHRGPGIVWRVPGWYSWTHISLKREIRLPIMENTSDATGLPGYVQLAYQWSRTRGDPVLQWLSYNEIENLEVTMDARVMSTAQSELMAVQNAAMMNPTELLAFANRVFAQCEHVFLAEYGTTLYYVSITVIGVTPQVAGSRIIAAALSGLPDGAVGRQEVIRATTVALDATQSQA